jgi:hypothetical protein
MRQIFLLFNCIFIASKLSCSYSSKYGEKRFHEWTWLTAHNSHINWEDNSVIYYATNQKIGIDKQLKSGVRGFMFDICFWKSCSQFEKFFKTCKCEGICLCHGECGEANAIKDGFAVKSFEYALRKIVKFLNKNKEEVITIILENYIADVKKMQNIFDRINGLNSLVFNPYAKEWNVINYGWPKIKMMIEANKRLLIIDDEKRGDHARHRPGIIRSRDFLIENHYEWFNDKYSWNISGIPLDLSFLYNATNDLNSSANTTNSSTVSNVSKALLDKQMLLLDMSRYLEFNFIEENLHFSLARIIQYDMKLLHLI